MESESKKIKVCFIQTNVYSLFNNKNNSIHGGSELQLYLIAKEFLKNEIFEISFVVGDFGQNDTEVFDGIRLYKSVTPKESDSKIRKLYQALVYYKLFKRINADVYFTSAANSTVGLVSFFCKLNNKKHIHRTANMPDCNMKYISSKGFIGRIYKYGLEKSDLIITQNEEHKQLLTKFHNVQAVVLRNLFIIDKNSNFTKKHILWVARCEKWKNPESYIELSNILKNQKFIMICPSVTGKEEYHKKIKKMAKKIKNLIFIDKVPFNEIQNYFNDAKIFVNTSEHEGFPNTFLQAGIGKTPILSLNVNPDNFIKKYDCGFCCDGNFDK